MAEWVPPQHVAPDGSEHLAALLVISTPDGFRSRWEGDEPSAAVRSEVDEFARQMSVEDFINAPRIDLSDLEDIDELAMLNDARRRGEISDRVVEIPRDEEFGRVVYLRVKVRACTAEQSAAWGRERVIDFEFGPMGGPPEYPRCRSLISSDTPRRLLERGWQRITADLAPCRSVLTIRRRGPPAAKPVCVKGRV